MDELMFNWIILFPHIISPVMGILGIIQMFIILGIAKIYRPIAEQEIYQGLQKQDLNERFCDEEAHDAALDLSFELSFMAFIPVVVGIISGSALEGWLIYVVSHLF